METKSYAQEEFVIERLGSELKNALKAIRQNPKQYAKKTDIETDPLKIGNFRISGEVHQWMYDNFSLSRLLKNTGFIEVKQCQAGESSIENFNTYLLDIEPDGSIRKPDSLFMEARKV